MSLGWLYLLVHRKCTGPPIVFTTMASGLVKARQVFLGLSASPIR
jgi:hypothetical protein